MRFLRDIFSFRDASSVACADAREALSAVMEAYRQGDYARALQATEGLRAADQETSYCFYHGAMLMHLGRLQEAESFQRRNVLRQEDSRRSALAYSMLGQNLQEQGRFEEAMDCFEAALRRCPGKGSVYRHMADLHLHRDCPTEALKQARLAVEAERNVRDDIPGLEESNRLNLGEALATLAWATAMARRDRALVDSMLAEAIPLMGSKARPTLAQVHYSAGRAYAALGDAAKAAEHLDEALRLDPNGTWGRLSRASKSRLAAAAG